MSLVAGRGQLADWPQCQCWLATVTVTVRLASASSSREPSLRLAGQRALESAKGEGGGGSLCPPKLNGQPGPGPTWYPIRMRCDPMLCPWSLGGGY